MHRGQVDDTAPVFGAHARQCQARGVKAGRQVDRQNGIPFIGRELLNRSGVLNASVVHQNIDAAKLGLCIGHHGFDLGRFAQIGAVVAVARLVASSLRGALYFLRGAFVVAKAVQN